MFVNLYSIFKDLLYDFPMKKIVPILTKLSGEIRSMENVLGMWIIGDNNHNQRLADIKAQCRTTLLLLEEILFHNTDMHKEKEDILSSLHEILTQPKVTFLDESKRILTMTRKYIEKTSLQHECDNLTLCRRIRDVLSVPESKKITVENISKYCTPDAFDLYFQKYDIAENGRRKAFLELARQARSWMRKWYKSFLDDIYNQMSALVSELPILPSDIKPKNISKANLPKNDMIIKKENKSSTTSDWKKIKSRKTKHAIDTDEEQTIPEQSNGLENTFFQAIQDMVLAAITDIVASESEPPEFPWDWDVIQKESPSLEEKLRTPKDPRILSFLKDKDMGKSFEYLLTMADNTLNIDSDNPTKCLLIAKEMYDLLLDRFSDHPEHTKCIQDRRKKNDWEIADYLAAVQKAKPIVPSVDTLPIEKNISSLNPKNIDQKTGKLMDEDIFFKI